MRFDDTLAFYVPPWSDQANHVGYDFFAFEGAGPDSFRLAVTVDGDDVAEVTTPYGEFPLPPEPADVEVTLDAARDAPWWEHSTSTTTTWRFASEPTGPDLVPVPLVQVDYQVDLDLGNETDAPNPISFRAHGPDGGEVGAFRAWWSIDDGESWMQLELADAGDGSYESTVPVPAKCDSSCFVSLRVEADVAEITAVEQEIIRAYTARYVTPTPPPTTPPTTPPTDPPTTPPSDPPTPTPTTTLPGTTDPERTDRTSHPRCPDFALRSSAPPDAPSGAHRTGQSRGRMKRCRNQA